MFNLYIIKTKTKKVKNKKWIQIYIKINWKYIDINIIIYIKIY